MTNTSLLMDGILTLVIIVWTVIVAPFIKSKTNTQQQQEIKEWVKIAVAAAEQIYTGQGRGTEKKNYVLSWLEEHGVTVDESRVDAMIEAAVYALKNGGDCK